ncbi:RNA polymerase sigma factor [Pseudarthrobacter sp. J1738]|uniref:RNA polymerase sigma factor n=1 Tax=unclassified Pseudarthrobacter TaxID=2647000 RepID=UPI003D28F7FC
MTTLPFERLIELHGGTVIRVCRAVLGPHADADDAWQETFLAALKAYPGLPSGANHEAWLVTIAHRKAIDVIRRRQRIETATDELPERTSLLGIPGAEHTELWEALASLTLKQRLAVTYHHIAGFSYKEIAELLDCTPAAARRAASDGMARMRDSLEAVIGERYAAAEQQLKVQGAKS